MKLAGHQAIKAARIMDTELHKHADSLDPERRVTVEEAEEIAEEDPALVWVEVDDHELRSGVELIEYQNIYIDVDGDPVVVETRIADPRPHSRDESLDEGETIYDVRVGDGSMHSQVIDLTEGEFRAVRLAAIGQI